MSRHPDGTVRPLLPRTFNTLSQAAEENAQSRIYLGVHWAFDKTAGMTEGTQIGDYTSTHMLLPLAKAKGR